MVVKGNHSTHRQRQAQATKEQIGAAARKLFAQQGYVATTIAAIAQAADIPLPTVYSAMGSKARILDDIAWRAIMTMDIDRHHQQALEQPDPADGLKLAAAIQRRQYEAMYDVVSVYQEAAATDPDIAKSVATVQANRENAFHRHLKAIQMHLSPGLSVHDAVTIYLTLALPEIYRSLVLDRHWTPQRYEQWLADHLITDLLGD